MRLHYHWLFLALVWNVQGQTLRFGTNQVKPGALVEFAATPNAAARLELSRLNKSASPIRGAFILPPRCTNLSQPFPLLIVSVPSGGSAIRQIGSMTNAALAEGWIVFAADGPKVDVNEDTIQYGWAMLSSALDQFTRTWPQTRQWPVACAGFSGGAKRSAAIAAALTKQQRRVVGVFMGGCNEDRATLGAQLFQAGPQFKRVPMFLSNGNSDPISTPTQASAVRESMLSSGFTAVRLETFSGKHQLSQEHLSQALLWFAQTAGLRRSQR